MNEGKTSHLGHRERMVEKLISNKGGLLDHELLEILLYFSIPRINTNDHAHKLLSAFGSVEEVFNASFDSLMSIKGIGKKTATEIVLVGEIIKRAKEESKSKIQYNAFGVYKNEIIELFKDLSCEMSAVLLLDKNKRLITKLIYESNRKEEVFIDVSDFAQAVSKNKPKFAILAHNHPSGVVNASSSDDEATTKINVLCTVHGVELLDHIIVANGDALSYNMEGKMDKIKEISDIKKIMKKIEEQGQYE